MITARIIFCGYSSCWRKLNDHTVVEYWFYFFGLDNVIIFLLSLFNYLPALMKSSWLEWNSSKSEWLSRFWLQIAWEFGVASLIGERVSFRLDCGEAMKYVTPEVASTWLFNTLSAISYHRHGAKNNLYLFWKHDLLEEQKHYLLQYSSRSSHSSDLLETIQWSSCPSL